MTTAEEKKAYVEEVKKAQEEADAALLDPVSADITESEWATMLQRRSPDDANKLFDITEEHGGPNIVADPEPPAEETPPAVEEPPAAETKQQKKS